MKIDDYTFADLTKGQFDALARNRPIRAERLLDEFERFVERDTDASDRIFPLTNGNPKEVFMVPPSWILRHLPDAAVIASVDHTNKTISALQIFEDSDGDGTPSHWAVVQQIAKRA